MCRAMAGFDLFCTKCTLEEDWGVWGEGTALRDLIKVTPGEAGVWTREGAIEMG